MKCNGPALLRPVLIGMLVIVNWLTITGCMETITPQLFRAEQSVIGKSEAELLACAGTPRASSSHDGKRVLSYYREGGVIEKSFPGSKGSRPEGERHRCTATVTMENVRITKVEYRMMPESSAAHGHCEEIFQRCGP